ncbi:MAG TPA: hypothetical protein VKB41_16245 [Steroidobacteraceae bacterium]|nr:hypothetical protein [Steroidobacteraceae bacterium]
MSLFHDWRIVFTVTFGALLLAACDVSVHKQGSGKDKGVDIHTPFGSIAVHGGEGAADTGLPLYPGAQPLQEKDDDDSQSARVNIGTSSFGVHLAVAKFQSSDTPQAIVDFYKDKMTTYGAVVECKGDVDFDASRQPVCKEESGGGEVQLVAGTEQSHRLVSVKPREGGSEFALVSIQLGERS